MFSPKTKQEIANRVQEILQEINDSELPDGEIQFILHVDGAEDWSWANITNNSAVDRRIPGVLVRNLSA